MNNIGTRTIETERLILRRLRLSDAEDMYNNWAADAEAARFWSWEPHGDISETRLLLDEWVQRYKDPKYYHWFIEDRELCQAIGYIYLSDIDEPPGTAAVHYLVGREYWNRGIASEACGAVLRFAFENLRAKRIATSHHMDNPASGRVLRKCGMRIMGRETRSFPECERISGDYHTYEVTYDDWRERR